MRPPAKKTTEEKDQDTHSTSSDEISPKVGTRSHQDGDIVERWIERAKEIMKVYSIGVDLSINCNVLSRLRYEGEHRSLARNCDH